MRNRAIALVVFATAVLLSAARVAAAPVAVSVSFFHDQLAPHGRWVTAASYGNVWIPGGVSAGWEPYVDGEWGYSDYGWTWVANDPWGDVPYHYGTWALVEPYGWVWIPGTVWAPAWVTWAYTDDYIGWAPVPPSFALSATGYFGPPIVVSAAHYVCVPARQFVGVRVASVRVSSQQSITIVNRAVKTTRYEVNNGFVRVAGPPHNKVERAVGRPIQQVSLRAQPTSMAAGGVVKGKTVHVVAPEQERARLTTEKVSAQPSRSEPKAASRPEAPARAESAERREPAPKASKVKPESTSSRNAPETHAKPEARKAEAERSQASSKPKADVEHSQAAAKPKAKPEPRGVEPREQSPRESTEPQHPKPEPQVQKRAEPKESVSREETAQKQQPKPKAKPQPPPSKEKEKPQKDSSDSRHER